MSILQRHTALTILTLAIIGSFGRAAAQDPRASAHEGSWSPDGKRILFAASPTARSDIFIANVDGTGVVQLTNDAFTDYYPVMSPDGRSIAYVSVRDSAIRLQIMKSDGSKLKDIGIVIATGQRLNPTPPSWSPDGKRIVYETTRNGSDEIFIVDADGSNDRRVASGALPAWSPDGRWISYTAPVDSAGRLFVMRTDGSQARQLTTTMKGQDIDSSWSPNNSFIAYVSVRRDPSGVLVGRYPKNLNEIHIVNFDGTNDRIVALTDEREFEARLSPDGRRLVYLREYTGTDGKRHTALFVRNVDGTDERNLFPLM